MLEVQKFLKNGGTLEMLKADYGISARVNERLGVTCLNYSQIMSPMGQKIVRECRALVLESTTWEVKSCSFERFFNFGEGHIPKDFDWDNFQTLEKLDGSLIHFWFHDTEGWQCGTRSVPDADTGMDDSGLTFKQLVIQTISEMGSSWAHWTDSLIPGYTFTFELTSPENMIVCDYRGQRKLTLIGIRNLETLKEVDVHQWHQPGYIAPWPVVKRYPGFTLDAVQEAVQKRDPHDFEGYVLVDKNFNRVKIKSSAYVFMSSRRDSLGKSNKARIELIQNDAVDDVLSSLPEFVQGKILGLQRKLKALVQTCDALYQTVKDEDTDKDFALKVQHGGYSSVMFALRRGKAVDSWEHFKRMSPKRVLEYLDEEDDEEETVCE